jgi:hypothetical protein
VISGSKDFDSVYKGGERLLDVPLHTTVIYKESDELPILFTVDEFNKHSLS